MKIEKKIEFGQLNENEQIFNTSDRIYCLRDDLVVTLYNFIRFYSLSYPTKSEILNEKFNFEKNMRNDFSYGTCYFFQASKDGDFVCFFNHSLFYGNNNDIDSLSPLKFVNFKKIPQRNSFVLFPSKDLILFALDQHIHLFNFKNNQSSETFLNIL